MSEQFTYYPTPPPSEGGEMAEYTHRELLDLMHHARIMFEELGGRVDPFLDIPAGNIAGYSSVNKFGRNDTITQAGGAEDIWDGGSTGGLGLAAYPFPATADITHIVSSAAGDTDIDCEVQGLDANWILTVQTATTNSSDGTTAEALTTPLRRVFRIKVLTSGVVGHITLKNVGASVVYAQVLIGNNQTLMALYTIPANKTAYMTKYYATINKGATKTPDAVTLKLFATDNMNGYPEQIKHVIGMEAGGETILEHDFKPYYKFTEKTDIRLEGTCIGSAATADVSAGFDLILVDN